MRFICVDEETQRVVSSLSDGIDDWPDARFVTNGGNRNGQSYELFAAEKPDAILILGDTNSCLCVISAKRLKIPVFHLEAGNRCKDENLPEKVIRRIVDVTSDVNLCYSENARRYIPDAGVRPENTYVVGSTMAEVLTANIDRIRNSTILEQLNLEPKKYILLSAHREENIDTESNFFSLMNAVNAMAQEYDMPVPYSCHPRSRKYIEARGFQFDSRKCSFGKVWITSSAQP